MIESYHFAKKNTEYRDICRELYNLNTVENGENIPTQNSSLWKHYAIDLRYVNLC